ncbi:hypothetical protein XMIN_3845 [Xanthomonas citri pv. mangiferaeindicae LMG 941]|nr:hypothetical protein XMIN_3845 [Xanthomonas citri pv. mangiferaeindicae LMG 941]
MRQSASLRECARCTDRLARSHAALIITACRRSTACWAGGKRATPGNHGRIASAAID